MEVSKYKITMSNQLNKIEVAVARLDEKVEQGFSSTHKRLDKVNGRLDKHDNRIAHNKEEIDKASGKTTAISFLIATTISVVGLILAYFRLR